MKKICYHIPGMDCDSEQSLIRMKPEGVENPAIPDLVTGGIFFGLVSWGALRILKLSK